jgi:hypothetical protein
MSNKWPDLLKESHKAVTEAKWSQIKANAANLSESPLGNNDNHRKEAEAIEALLESEFGTAEETHQHKTGYKSLHKKIKPH